MALTFLGFVTQITNTGGMAGEALSTSYGNGRAHTDFPGGGSPQSNQSLPCNFEAFTDYLQEYPWPGSIAMMSSPTWTGPSATGLPNCVAALYLGTGMGTPGSIGGFPVFEGQLTNPGALGSLPVPAGTWPGVPKMADGSTAIPAVPCVGWNLGGASLSAIASGSYDSSTIIPCAQGCRNWPADTSGNPAYPGQPGGQVIIRLMHEMNGTWSSYNPSTQGETCTDFVNAWRHIVQVFANQGATNARWLWCPNICSSGAGTQGPTPWNITSGTCKLLYPGDAYVDYVGLDGYNKNVPNWLTFSNVFQASYNWMYNGDSFITPITTKPMIIGEMGCFEDDEFTSPPQTKAAWISSVASTINASMPNVIGGYWWHSTGGTGGGLEFFVDSSPASAAAWKTLADTYNGRPPLIRGVTALLAGGVNTESGPFTPTLPQVTMSLTGSVANPHQQYKTTLTGYTSVSFTPRPSKTASILATLSTLVNVSAQTPKTINKSLIYFVYQTIIKTNLFSFVPGLINPGFGDPGQTAGQTQGLVTGGVSTSVFMLEGRAKEYFVTLSAFISAKSRMFKGVFRRLAAKLAVSPVLFPVPEVITGPHGQLHIVLPGTCVVRANCNFNIAIPPPVAVITGVVIQQKTLTLFLPGVNMQARGVIIRSGPLNIVISCRGMGLPPQLVGLDPDAEPVRVLKKIAGPLKISVKRTAAVSPRSVTSHGSLSPVPSAEWRVVSNTQIQVNHLSTQYILIPVQVTKNGAAYNPSNDEVQFAFMPTAVQVPQNADWVLGGWDIDSSNFLYPYSAKCLIGPSGNANLNVGTYVIYVKIIDSPEIPVLTAGQLIIT